MQNNHRSVLFFIKILYRLFELYFYHVAADRLTSLNGGKFC